MLMLTSIRRGIARRIALAVAAVAITGSVASSVRAADNAYSLSLGTDFTSHFVSYGADVWGGGNDANPFGEDSTIFVYGTLSLAINDQMGAFVNVWTDNNQNTDDSIGGRLQEVDVNIGLTYTMEKFTFGITHGCWWYAGDEEKLLDFSVAYNDADMIAEGFALNPSFTAHWRYDKHESQADEGWALIFGIKPTYTINKDSQYPISLAAPINVTFLTDDFYGGDSGLGYVSLGVSASIPLAFVPEKYGAWSAGASLTYFCTEEDAIPSNSEQGFFVSALSIGLSI
jgi:hypothetical protein